MLEEKRLRNDGTGAARSEQASQGSDEVDEKNDQIAHQRIVAGRESQGIMGETTIRQPQVMTTVMRVSLRFLSSSAVFRELPRAGLYAIPFPARYHWYRRYH